MCCVARLGLAVSKVTPQMGCQVVELGSGNDLQKLLGMGDLTIGGKRLDMVVVRHRWNSSRIFEWVAGELRIEQESWILGGKVGSGRSQGAERDRAAVREAKADVPRARGGKGNGAGRQAPSSTAATQGSAGPQQAATKVETGDVCYTCRKLGRPYNHRWLTCPYAQGTLRRGRRAPSQGPGGKQQ